MKIGNPQYEFRGKKYDLRMTYGYVIKTLPEFGINLTSLFEENNLDSLMFSMLVNDDMALKLWWSHIKKDYPGDEGAEYDKVIEDLKSNEIHEFKEAWWGAVYDFFDPLRKEMLMELLAVAEKLIRNQILSVIKTLGDGSSNLQPKQES